MNNSFMFNKCNNEHLTFQFPSKRPYIINIKLVNQIMNRFEDHNSNRIVSSVAIHSPTSKNIRAVSYHTDKIS